MKYLELLPAFFCGEQAMTTFTDEQWDTFAFIVSDNPRLASLLSQVKPYL